MEPCLQKVWFGTIHIIDINVAMKGRGEEPSEYWSYLGVNFTRGNPDAKSKSAQSPQKAG